MKYRKLFLFSVLIFWSLCCFSQNDAHYNSTQFGLKGTLLSGTLVAGDDDASMIFYNPAAIAYVRDKAFDISLLVPNYQRLKLKNAFGTTNNLKSGAFQLVPTLVTFKLPFQKNPKLGFAATILRPGSFKNSLRFSNSKMLDGNVFESFVEYNYQKSETWLGLGVSYELNEHFYIGMSQFVTIRTLSYDQMFFQTIQADPNVGEPIKLVENRLDVDLSAHLGFISKLGFNYKSEKLNIGLTLTTPNYGNPINSATYEFGTLEKLSEDGALKSTSYVGEDDKIKLKTPFSIALGASVQIQEKTRLYLSSEFFTGIKPYAIANSEAANDFTFQTAKKPVFNFAIGWEIKLSEKWSLLGGARTNFNNSRNVEQSQYQLQTSTWNIYHLSNGFNFISNVSKFTFGIDYGFSYDRLERSYFNVAEFNEPFEPSTQEIVNVNYQSFTFLVTYGFLIEEFVKKITKD